MYKDLNLTEEQKRIQEFSYAISHDLGSAIRGVGQLTRLLESSIAEKLSDKERYWIELICTSADKGQAMIDALAVYTRLANDANNKQSFNIHQLISQLVKGCVTDIALVLDIEQAIVTVNKAHFSLLLTNLLDNAAQAYPSSAEEPLIVKVAFKQCEQWQTLSVEDNGLGLTASQIDHVVLPFQSIGMNQNGMHLGMGLTYCQRIAELSKGELILQGSELSGLKVVYRWPSEHIEGDE